MFGPVPGGTDIVVTAFLTAIPAVALGLFVRLSAAENGVAHPLAWSLATTFAGLTDSLAFGSCVGLALYFVVRETNPEQDGRIRRWLVHRGRDETDSR
ncbi:hypothetical protein BRD15_05650 [Halobacteriales archaeon SW_6_65_15]|nr:MAG: hypothetical protein BRD15_05650 [Halobacteriales archaeon SW_6_65_15]